MNSAFINSIYQSGLAAGLSDVQARLMAAQAAHESGNGVHAPGNNFFGIKAGGSWSGPTQSLMTGEEVNGRNVRMRQDFRKYASPEQAIQDRISFMQQKFPAAFNATDINSAVAGLQHGRFGSYATDSNYAQKLQPYLSAIGTGGTPSPYAGLADGPKGQESYGLAGAPVGLAAETAPHPLGGILAGVGIPQDAANEIAATLAGPEDGAGKHKSPMQTMFGKLAETPDAPAVRFSQMGDVRQGSDGLLKLLNSPTIADLLLKKRLG